jgi:hypothetical protein
MATERSGVDVKTPDTREQFWKELEKEEEELRKKNWKDSLEFISNMQIVIKYPMKYQIKNEEASQVSDPDEAFKMLAKLLAKIDLEDTILSTIEEAILKILGRNFVNFEYYFVRHVCKPVWEKDERTGINTGIVCLGYIFDLHAHVVFTIKKEDSTVTVTATVKPEELSKEEFEKRAVRCDLCGKLYEPSDNPLSYCAECDRSVCYDHFDFEICACVECAPKLKEEEEAEWEEEEEKS